MRSTQGEAPAEAHGDPVDQGDPLALEAPPAPAVVAQSAPREVHRAPAPVSALAPEDPVDQD